MLDQEFIQNCKLAVSDYNVSSFLEIHIFILKPIVCSIINFRYSRDRYIRPQAKDTFLKDRERVDGISTLEIEFTELEELAIDTIQRRISQSMLPVNRRRNRQRDQMNTYFN